MVEEIGGFPGLKLVVRDPKISPQEITIFKGTLNSLKEKNWKLVSAWHKDKGNNVYEKAETLRAEEIEEIRQLTDAASEILSQNPSLKINFSTSDYLEAGLLEFVPAEFISDMIENHDADPESSERIRIRDIARYSLNRLQETGKWVDFPSDLESNQFYKEPNRQKWEDLAEKMKGEIEKLRILGKPVNETKWVKKNAKDIYTRMKNLLKVCGWKENRDYAGKKIFVISSAAGLDVRILRDMGIDAVGVVTDEDLFKVGNNIGVISSDVVFHTTASGFLSENTAKFDAILGINQDYSQKSDSLPSFLRNAQKHMRDGGHFLFDGLMPDIKNLGLLNCRLNYLDLFAGTRTLDLHKIQNLTPSLIAKSNKNKDSS